MLPAMVRGAIARFPDDGRRCAVLCVVFIVCALSGCSGGGSPGPEYTISGSISHLDNGAMTISDGSEVLPLTQGATSFAFQHPLQNGAAYNVTVVVQPANENCVVSNGTGMLSGQNVQNVAITCNSALSAPTTLGVYPADLAGATDARVFLPVGVVGSQQVTINAILDTGSAGVDLDALEVFPSSIVTTSGFVFPSGQTSLTYNGITVTNVTAMRKYGGQGGNPTEDIGNLGFAQITVGGGAQVTTAVVPVLFVYQHEANNVVGPPTGFTDLIGVNPDMGALIVAGSPTTSSPTLAPCTPQSTTTCGAASPFRFLTYGSGVDEGYVLTQVTLNQCAINTAGSCTLENALIVGPNAAVSSSFSTTALTSCQPVAIMNANSASEQICSQVIPNVQIASGGSSYSGPAIFDSGQPQVLLEVPQGDTFPDALPVGSAVSVTTSSGFGYAFQTGIGYATTTVYQNATASNFSNLGINYFTQHSLLVDYSKAVEGFK